MFLKLFIQDYGMNKTAALFPEQVIVYEKW